MQLVVSTVFQYNAVVNHNTEQERIRTRPCSISIEDASKDSKET